MRSPARRRGRRRSDCSMSCSREATCNSESSSSSTAASSTPSSSSSPPLSPTHLPQLNPMRLRPRKHVRCRHAEVTRRLQRPLVLLECQRGNQPHVAAAQQLVKGVSGSVVTRQIDSKNVEMLDTQKYRENRLGANIKTLRTNAHGTLDLRAKPHLGSCSSSCMALALNDTTLLSRRNNLSDLQHSAQPSTCPSAPIASRVFSAYLRGRGGRVRQRMQSLRKKR